jgi:glycosyltransferase involved in cell wall biosynthesis
MPVYNAENTLAECLDSIFRQSLQDFEIVAVNDFSTDGSLAIMQSYHDARIRIIDNKIKGIVPALNLGLQSCQSDLVARMDADDVMYADRLQKQFDVLNTQAEITLCATQARKFPVEIIQQGYLEYMRWQNACLTKQDIENQIYIESPFAHPTVMFRRQRIIELGGYMDGDFAEDYELWLRLFHAGESMMKLDEVLLDWRESDHRLSRVSQRYSDTAFEKLRAQYLAKDMRLQGREIVFWGAGRKTRQRMQYLIAQGIKPSAWIDIDNKKVGKEYLGAKTYLPAWLKPQDENSCDKEQQNKKPFVLNCVRNHGVRDLCRQFLDGAGYKMGKDYLDIA